jgi:hypothetical protein
MAQFWKKSIRKTEARREAVVRFVGEQEGGPARDLKKALGAVLAKHATVAEAYLARVVFGSDPVFKVTLCICAPEEPGLVRAVDECFQEMFEGDAQLELLFLSDSQRAELRGVCAPFFVRDGVGPV